MIHKFSPIWNFWLSWKYVSYFSIWTNNTSIVNLKYSDRASCLPIQFRKPSEKGHTRISFSNFPFLTNRSGINFSGSLKYFGLFIIPVNDPWIPLFFSIRYPSRCVLAVAWCGSVSATGKTRKFSNRIEFVTWQLSVVAFPSSCSAFSTSLYIL